MNLAHFEKFESYIPVDLLSPKMFLIGLGTLMAFLLVRFFLMVGPFYIVFWKRCQFAKTAVHAKKIRKGQVEFEIKWALVSTVIFALAAYLMGLLWQLGFTKIYLSLDEFGIWYLPASFVLVSLIHEVYFYWTHVWMHIPSIYKKVHAVHHYSIQTTPWASFSFHPLEAVVHAVFVPLVVLLVPLHPLVILTYLTFMTVTAISNHLGHEILLPKILRRYFISGDHHSLHHTKFNCNYGLYFRFMDQMFNTENMESR